MSDYLKAQQAEREARRQKALEAQAQHDAQRSLWLDATRQTLHNHLNATRAEGDVVAPEQRGERTRRLSVTRGKDRVDVIVRRDSMSSYERVTVKVAVMEPGSLWDRDCTYHTAGLKAESVTSAKTLAKITAAIAEGFRQHAVKREVDERRAVEARERQAQHRVATALQDDARTRALVGAHQVTVTTAPGIVPDLFELKVTRLTRQQVEALVTLWEVAPQAVAVLDAPGITYGQTAEELEPLDVLSALRDALTALNP